MPKPIVTTKTQTQTDWERIKAVTDEEIARSVADDPDAAPIFTEEELKAFQFSPARRQR